MVISCNNGTTPTVATLLLSYQYVAESEWRLEEHEFPVKSGYPISELSSGFYPKALQIEDATISENHILHMKYSE